MELDKIPGYKRAATRARKLQDTWRDRALSGVAEHICGIEAAPLTLRAFVQLCLVESPFVSGGIPEPGDVGVFLWRVSPAYNARDNEARREFLISIAGIPFAHAVRGIYRFLDRMLLDRPPGSGSASVSDTSFAASVVHELAAAYGWDDEKILNLSMPRLFQYLRRIRRDRNPRMPLFNPLISRLTKGIVAGAIEKKKGAE